MSRSMKMRIVVAALLALVGAAQAHSATPQLGPPPGGDWCEGLPIALVEEIVTTVPGQAPDHFVVLVDEFDACSQLLVEEWSVFHVRWPNDAGVGARFRVDPSNPNRILVSLSGEGGTYFVHAFAEGREGSFEYDEAPPQP